MADWFIARNGQQEGPLSEQAVRIFISSGQLKSEDPVWCQGMAEWVSAGRSAEFASAFQSSGAASGAAASPQPTPVAYAGANMGSRTTVLTDRALDMLRKTKPWARLLAVVIFIVGGLLALGGLIMVALGVLASAANYGSTTGDRFGAIVIGILYFIFAFLYLVPGMYLNRYASRIGSLLGSGREDHLEQALEAQKSFWKFVGIAAVLTIILWVGMLFVGVGAVAINASRSNTPPQPFSGAPAIPSPPSVPNRPY